MKIHLLVEVTCEPHTLDYPGYAIYNLFFIFCMVESA